MTDTTVVSEERVEVDDRRSYEELLRRLNEQSITPGRHFDAYADIAWDGEAFAIDPEDPRWELEADDPLGSSAWYRSQPAGVRARIGLHMIATHMKIGLQFESVLKRGLLEYVSTLPNGAPEFRYAYHEVIEEAQHSLMFQEFINRSGFDVPGMPKLLEIASRRVVLLGRKFPSLFFFFVLGGEDPIDYVQRQELRSTKDLHPLLERVMRIHVTEEARHLSFARHWLREHTRNLGAIRRWRLAVAIPLVLGTMAQQMMRPSPDIVRTYHIPRSVLRSAYGRNDAHKAEVRASLRKVRKLAQDLGLVNSLSRPVWKRLGIWE